MVYLLIKFDDGESVRAKSIKTNGNTSFEIITDKDELLLFHLKFIKEIIPTTSSWKALKADGVVQAKVV